MTHDDIITVERFQERGLKRPRYRLRYAVRQSWLLNGFTCGSYRLKRDAERRARELRPHKETA
jgi:hypothetical protein